MHEISWDTLFIISGVQAGRCSAILLSRVYARTVMHGQFRRNSLGLGAFMYDNKRNHSKRGFSHYLVFARTTRCTRSSSASNFDDEKTKGSARLLLIVLSINRVGTLTVIALTIAFHNISQNQIRVYQLQGTENFKFSKQIQKLKSHCIVVSRTCKIL